MMLEPMNGRFEDEELTAFKQIFHVLCKHSKVIVYGTGVTSLTFSILNMESWKLYVLACVGLIFLPVFLVQTAKSATIGVFDQVTRELEEHIDEQSSFSVVNMKEEHPAMTTSSKKNTNVPSPMVHPILSQEHAGLQETHTSSATTQAQNTIPKEVFRGTIIELTGSIGYIIALQSTISLWIAFDIQDVKTNGNKIVVGCDVAYSLQHMNTTTVGKEQVPKAIDVVLVPTQSGLSTCAGTISSKDMILCKQEREEMFAKAMCSLSSISPRNQPVVHQIDLIKYAQEIDDLEMINDEIIGYN